MKMIDGDGNYLSNVAFYLFIIFVNRKYFSLPSFLIEAEKKQKKKKNKRRKRKSKASQKPQKIM